MRLAALAAVLVAAAAAPAGAAAETVTIELTHRTEGGRWRVEYRLESPAERLEFLRRFDHRRQLDWHPDDPALEIVRHGEREVLQRRDGRTFDRAAVGFRSDRAPLVKDYPLNAGFTDGSEWIYTGHLYALPIRGGQRPARRTGFALTIHPATGEPVVLQGRRHTGTVRWTDEDPEASGTFAYFGFIAPLPSGGFPAVIDPGLPPYLRRAFQDYLPRIAGLYRERLRHELSARPGLFITYNPQASSRGRGGDVLPSAMSFKFTGVDWREEHRGNVIDAIGLIAHEAAHLWNGQRFRSSLAEDAPWMHEGGAEAFAWLALRELELIDEPQLRERIDWATGECLGPQGLDGGSLQAAFAQRRYDAAYTCGAVMNLLVHRAAGREGLFGFWHDLFDAAQKNGAEYDTVAFLAAAARLDPALARFLERLWTGPTAPDAKALAAQLERKR